MTNTNSANLQSILLDLIRYLLATVVVIGHGLGFFLGYFDGYFPRVFPHPQSIAVVGFFYLSGFLIVGSQIRQSEAVDGSLKKYLFDRATRVYVTLIPSLLFVVIADLFFKKFSTISLDIVTYFTSPSVFIKNTLLIPSMPYGTMRPIWSLMYEWWIYLLFGGIYFFRTNMVASLLLIIAGGYYTFHINSNGEAGHIWIIWALGGFCAYLQRRVIWRDLNQVVLRAASALFLVAAGVSYFYSKDAYDLIAGIALSLSIFIFTNQSGGYQPQLLPLAGIAKKVAGFSFTLFLTHYTVLTYTKEYLKIDGWLGLTVGFILSNLIAYVIAFFTEYRLARFKRFLFKLTAENLKTRTIE